MARHCLIGIALCAAILIAGCGSVQKNLTSSPILVEGLYFLISDLAPREIVTVAEGQGSSKEKAIESALISAVQKVLGVLVVSETTVRNNKLISDIAIAYSSGIVREYTEEKCSHHSVYKCVITAVVSLDSFRDRAQSDQALYRLEKNQLYSEYLTIMHLNEQREKLIKYYFSDIRKSGLSLVAHSVKVGKIIPGGAEIEIKYSVSWNARFKENFIEFAERMQRDTGGHTDYDINDFDIFLGNGMTYEKPIRIKTKNPDMKRYLTKIATDPIEIMINPFSYCDKIILADPPRIFDFDKYFRDRTLTLRVPESSLKNIRSLSLTATC